MTYVALRVDASQAIGTGHLRRCLSLAQALMAQGAHVCLIVRALDAVAEQVLHKAPCSVHWLAAPTSALVACSGDDLPPHHTWAGVGWQQDARDTAASLAECQIDWLVVDHYAFDARWHEAMRNTLGSCLLVIDDTADRLLAADTVLDHNWDHNHSQKYANRLQHEPLWLTGPRFALLSPAYREAPRYVFSPVVCSIGIFMGGTDPGGITAQVLAACRHEAGFSGHIEVVSTATNPHLAALRMACMASPATTLTLDATDLCAFFTRHDLHIGAGGGATWERCCISAPTIALKVADNQSVVVHALDQLGAFRVATLSTLPEVLCTLMASPDARLALSQCAGSLVDGRGAQRVALSVLRGTLRLRPAALGDAHLLHGWRNHPAVRAFSGCPDAIAWDDHKRWLERSLQVRDRRLFVAEVGSLPVGSIRFDRLAQDRLEVSLYLDPDFHGLGLGSHLLRAGERQLETLMCEPFTVEACVVAGNTASQRLFEACGYSGGPLRYSKQVRPASDELIGRP